MRGNNLVLFDPYISEKHLFFRFVRSDSRWFVSDLDSLNGTILNGSRIQACVPVAVTDGDVLKIGEKTTLGVKILVPNVLEGNDLNEEGDDLRGRRVTGSRGLSRVSEEKRELQQAQSKVSAPVRGLSTIANTISASNEADERFEMGQMGAEKSREDVVMKNAKEAGKGRGKASTDLEEENESDSSLVLILDIESSDSESVNTRISADSSIMVIEEGEGEDDIGVEERNKNGEKGCAYFDKTTLKKWISGMGVCQPKVTDEERKKILDLINEQTRNFDKFGSDW